jgi:hypothetical protein
MKSEQIVELANKAGFNPISYMGSNLIIFKHFARLAALAYVENMIAELADIWDEDVNSIGMNDIRRCISKEIDNAP